MVQYGFRWYRWIAMLIIKRRPLFLVSQTLFFSTGQLTSCVFYLSHSKPILPCHFWTSRFSHFSKHCPTLHFHSLISFLHLTKHCIAQETFSSQGAQGFTFMLTKVGCDEPGGQTIAVLLQLGNKNTNYNILNPTGCQDHPETKTYHIQLEWINRLKPFEDLTNLINLI